MSLAADETTPIAIHGLWREPLLRLQALIAVVVAVPYFLPDLTTDNLWYWSSASELPLVIVTLLAFRQGLDRLCDPAERRFWNLWTLAITAWLVKTVSTILMLLVSTPSIGFELAVNCVFFLFYFFAAMALESRPNLPSSPLASALRSVERVGTFSFFTGLLLYLAVVPALFELDTYGTSSLLLYGMFDLYLIVRLGGFLRGTRDPVWRRTYSWLLATALLWLITDSIEMLTWAGPLRWLEEGSTIDLVWLLPWLTLVAAARVRHLPTAAQRERQQQLLAFPLGPLVTFTVAVPILHFGFIRSPLWRPETAPVLEILALLMLILLATLVVIRQELLRGETRRLEVERERNQLEIEHLAFHDPLTGVPNRRLMTDRLEVGLSRALRFERKLAVMLLDIDDFKAVNDTRGHAVGDEVLCQVARRLGQCVRGGDTVARFGGDEFVAIVEGLTSEREARGIVGAMRDSLSRPFAVGEEPLSVSTTVGVAVFPDHGSTAEEILKQADVAMYRQRANRGSNAPE